MHARNLFHTAIALYDAWAAFDGRAAPYLLGHRVGGYSCGFVGIKKPVDVQTAREEAISYTAYRLLVHRFAVSPGARGSLNSFRSLMSGWDTGRKLVAVSAALFCDTALCRLCLGAFYLFAGGS
ncbi:MAG: hypothetical protein ACI906_000899 [Candidatus Latescibacterota bacterium]